MNSEIQGPFGSLLPPAGLSGNSQCSLCRNQHLPLPTTLAVSSCLRISSTCPCILYWWALFTYMFFFYNTRKLSLCVQPNPALFLQFRPAGDCTRGPLMPASIVDEPLPACCWSARLREARLKVSPAQVRTEDHQYQHLLGGP